jgi:serine/threonine-protein kinase PRP4
MSLREVLKKNDGGVTLDAVRVYAHQILIGLDYLHKQGLIHADFKPDNLLVNENDQVLKICDLGSACELHETYDLTAYLASRFYRAPEIILGIKYDYAIDMWAVGCTLFEFWTGKILFQGETNNQMLRAMMEVRGKFSLKLLKKGAYSGRFFNDDESFMSVQKAPFGNQASDPIPPAHLMLTSPSTSPKISNSPPRRPTASDRASRMPARNSRTRQLRPKSDSLSTS